MRTRPGDRPLLWTLSIAMMFALLIGCELSPKTPIEELPPAGSPEEVVARARENIKLDRLKDACEALDALLDRDPQNVDALSLRAIAYMREGKVYQAVKDLSAAAQIAPSVDVYYNLGNVLQQGGYYDRALVAYRAASELAPDDPEVLNNYASALLNMQRTSEAQGVLQRVVVLRPNDPQAYTNLGISYERQENWSQAESNFLKALEIDPTYYPAQYNIAKMYEVKGDAQSAKEHYRRYLEIRPDAPDRRKVENRAGLWEDNS